MKTNLKLKLATLQNKWISSLAECFQKPFYKFKKNFQDKTYKTYNKGPVIFILKKL